MKNKLDCLKLINFIEKSIDFKNYILPCHNILIAYSGGQDSSALLAIFYILSKKWHFNIGVVYCNHNWTSSTAESNAAFETIQNLNLPFYFVDSKNGSAVKPENKARAWRYQAFTTLLNHFQYDLVLTGHTLSDCAETIIFNLCRGSGLKGVCSLKKFQTFPYQTLPLFQFQIQLFDSNDFKNYSHITIFKDRYNKNVFKMQPSFQISNWIFACYLKKQKTINLNNNNNLRSEVKRKTFVIQNKLNSPTQKVSFLKKQQSEQFMITFFDPIIYLFTTSRPKQKKPLHFSSRYVCSLFPTLKFYLSSNLKNGTNSAFLSQTTLNQKRFEVLHFKSKRFNNVIFFIQQGLKSKRNKVQFKALLNRKLKERKSLTPFYYLQPAFTKDRIYKESFTGFLTNKWFGLLNQQSSYFLRSSYDLNRNNCIQSKLIIYRPLISMNRKVISLFDQQLELKLIIDQSNNDVNLTRNFIRQKILPLLKQINPQVEQNLYKFSQIASFYLDQTGDINFDSKRLNIFKP